MNFIQFSIRNPVKVSVGVILAVMFGFLAYAATPVQLTPDVEEPEITITTTWPGASAQEIEREIIEEQEEQLKSVQGLREFKSQSSDSTGTITLEFAVGTDLGEAAARVRDKLNQVPAYPEDADEPVITTVNPNSNAIAWFILKPRTPTQADLKSFVQEYPDLEPVLEEMIDGTKKIALSRLEQLAKTHPELLKLARGKNDPAKMKKFAEDFIEARFERVDGVANSNVLGGREMEFRVVVDPSKLAGYHLTIDDLHTALRNQNQNTSGGDIREGKNKNVIRTIGQYDDPEKVEDTIVTLRNNSPIRVRDVATVNVDYKKTDGIVRQKGVACLAVNAQQEPGTNLIEVMGPPVEELDLNGDGEITQLELDQTMRLEGDSLKLACAELNTGILKQMGLQLEQVYDQTDYLNSATKLVQNNIFIGGALAIFVLLLFLRSPRSVVIVGLSIPISVIATFLFVRGFGRSINVISLAGMAFAVGMVVDNAIVVLENIYRHYQMGDDPETASAKGAKEVWGAVLASTLTTLAVFVPVIFVEGQAGQLFRDIAIAISCAVGLSLIVSITVIPTAARRILKDHKRGEPQTDKSQGNGQADSSVWKRRLKTGFGLFALGQKVTDFFASSIYKLQTMPGNLGIRLVIVVVFVSASILGAIMLAPQTEYLPDGNRNLVIAIMKPPPGYNVEQMIRLGQSIEPDIAPYWEAEAGSPEEKALDGPRIDNFFFVARGTQLFMGARSVDPLRAHELVPVIAEAARKVPGVFAFATQASLFESAISGGRSIDIEITGPDLETLVEETQATMGMVMQEFPPSEGHQLQPTPNPSLSSPELHVTPLREKAAEQGIHANSLGYAVDALVDGAYAGDYWHEGEKIDLVIYGADEYSRHTHDIASLPLATPQGNLVPLSAIADVNLTRGPESIHHSERERTYTLQLKPSPAVPLETALEIVNEKIRQPMLERPAFRSGLYSIRLAGTADKLEDTRIQLQGSLMVAMIITYLLMAALFESFFYPLIIMISVMLAMVGGFGGLAILNLFTPQALDMLTMLGFVILIGTVVNNAILIVHQALNHMREDGYDEKLAVTESVRSRIRPIFMSTMTTVLGMLPLVLPVPTIGAEGLMWVSGAGSELYRGLGSVVLGGLILSTVFTLVLIPVGFSLALDLKTLLARLFGVKPTPETGPPTRKDAVAAKTSQASTATPKPHSSPAGSPREPEEEPVGDFTPRDHVP